MNLEELEKAWFWQEPVAAVQGPGYTIMKLGTLRYIVRRMLEIDPDYIDGLQDDVRKLVDSDASDEELWSSSSVWSRRRSPVDMNDIEEKAHRLCAFCGKANGWHMFGCPQLMFNIMVGHRQVFGIDEAEKGATDESAETGVLKTMPEVE